MRRQRMSVQLALLVSVALAACIAPATVVPTPATSAPTQTVTTDLPAVTTAPTATAPPPAATTEPPFPNLALHRPVTASLALPDFPAALAVDGIAAATSDNWWGAGAHAPQWLTIDLGGPATISLVRLHVSQSPAGETRHLIYGWGAGSAQKLLHTFRGATADGDVLAWTPPEPLTGLQYLRVETAASPSWVAWREVEIFGQPEAAVALSPVPEPGSAEPSVVFVNGPILTMDPALPRAEALAYQGDRILAVGSEAAVLAAAGPQAQVIDLQGQALLPGFIDSHAHRIGDRGLAGQATAAEAIQQAIELGWTSLHELFVHDVRLAELQALAQTDQLRVRVAAYLPLNSQFDDTGDWYQAYQPGQTFGPYLKVAGLKITLDQEWGETIFMSPEQLTAVVREAHDLGWPVATHIFAAQSTEMILDALEAALAGESNANYRHRLEHAAIVTDEQLARIAALDLIVSVQLSGTPGYPRDATFQRLVPPEQRAYVARFRDMLAAGVFMLGNTDAPWGTVDWRGGGLPTAPGSPGEALYEAATRILYGGRVPEDWQIAQTISVAEALPLLTINGAYATFEEDQKGSLTPGKLADLVVLSADPLAVPVDDLPRLTNLLTIIGGRVEYCAPGASVCPAPP